MCLFAKRVRVVCLRISVWCCMVCLLCVVCNVCACGVECVCSLLMAPFALRVSVCCYVFVWFVYNVSCGIVWFVCLLLT